MIRISGGGTPPENIRCLIIRELLHNIILYWKRPTGVLAHPVKLQATTIYVQLCICGSIAWTLSHDAWIPTFVMALEQLINSYPSITRLIVYFCGLDGRPFISKPTARRYQTEFPRWIALGFCMDEIIEQGAHEDHWLPIQTDEEDHTQYMLSSLTVAEPGMERKVSLEFYNSNLICSKSCVLA